MKTTRFRSVVTALLVLAAWRTAFAQFDDVVTCGDADRDGVVSVTDGVLALRMAAGLGSSCLSSTCDADRDGGYGTTDGVLILRAAAGLATLYCREPVNAWVRALRDGEDEWPLLHGRPPAPTGGAPAPSAGVQITTTVVPAQVHPLIVPFDFDASSPGVADGDLIIAVQTAEGTLASGYFVVPFASIDLPGSAFLGFEIARELGAEPFALALATRVGDAVSDYRTFPLAVAGPPTLHFVELHSEGTGIDRTAMAISPDGRHLYVVELAVLDGGVMTFERDARDGTIRLVSEIEHLGPITAMAISPDGAFVYLSALDTEVDSGAIVVCRRDATTGALAVVQRLRNGDGGTTGLVAFGDLLLSPLGDFLYASAGHRSHVLAPDLMVFRRDAANGTLQFVEAQGAPPGPSSRTTGLTLARSEGGDFIYFAGTRDTDSSSNGNELFLATLATYRRSQETGRLTLLEERVLYSYASVVDWIGDVADVLVGSDGSIYVATESSTGSGGFDDPQLLRFGHHSQTDELVPVDVITNFTDGLDELWRPVALARTLDGSRVYLLSGVPYHGGGLLSFERDPATGRLEYRESQVDGVAGARGLRGPNDVAVSADGAFVYVTGVDPTLLHGSVAVFATQ